MQIIPSRWSGIYIQQETNGEWFVTDSNGCDKSFGSVRPTDEQITQYASDNYSYPRGWFMAETSVGGA